MRLPGRSSAPRDCRYPRRRRISARAVSGRWCRTSCRNGLGSARGPSSCRESLRDGRRSSSIPSQPKSRAATVDKRYMPRFVGDVRRATSPFGSSWKLSGGNAWFSGPTKVSKKRHVRRAILRSMIASALAKGTARVSGWGALTARTITGEKAQSTMKGAATATPPGFARNTMIAALDRDDECALHADKERPGVAARTGPSRRRGDPLQEVPTCDVEANDRSHDRVDHQASLVREKCSARVSCARAMKKSVATARTWVRFEIPRRRGMIPRQKGSSAGIAIVANYEGRPDQRIGERKGPSGQQCENRPRRGERAPQIVNDLPFADQGSGRSCSVTALIFCVPENPRQQLPIAARPAVLACRGDLVVPRKLLEELDVARESGSGEQPFEEIVTQQRILGNASGE